MSDPGLWLTLLQAPGIGARSAAELLRHFGSIDKVFSAGNQDLQALGISAEARRAMRTPDSATLKCSLEWLGREQNHFLALDDEAYPALLKTIPDPPMLLFIRGNKDCLGLPQLAMVGSRNPTPAGLDTAKMFARHLSVSGLAITSGLALGIDSASHLGALDAGGVTIAVCGCGLDRVYPAGQESLAESICQSGALVSEFPPGTPPSRKNFPQRNRIVSGLSVGALVVEAARASGSLITARHAAEQGREVFAVPGSIHNPQSRGCHQLIRQGAKLVESAADIFEELGPMVSVLAETAREDELQEPAPPAVDHDRSHQQLLITLGEETLPIDTLAERSGLTAREVSSMLLILELQGLVQTAPGGRYCKTARR
ncbi:MAG: DNA-processing protein DprA [Gammaproteobacteria bacterium]